MTLRKRTLVFTGAIVLIMIVIISAFMWQLMVANLSELEDQEASREVGVIVSALQGELSALNRISGDWSSWNETYEFVIDGNEEYVQANLGEATLANLDVNLMLFYNRSGGWFTEKPSTSIPRGRSPFRRIWRISPRTTS
jgi:sensor domain CHASE-containing protein